MTELEARKVQCLTDIIALKNNLQEIEKEIQEKKSPRVGEKYQSLAPGFESVVRMKTEDGKWIFISGDYTGCYSDWTDYKVMQFTKRIN